MTRPLSKVAPELVGRHDTRSGDSRRCGQTYRQGLEKLSRPGFQVVMYDTLEDFYLAEALEYIRAGGNRRAIIPRGFAARSARRSSCRWWQGW